MQNRLYFVSNKTLLCFKLDSTLFQIRLYFHSKQTLLAQNEPSGCVKHPKYSLMIFLEPFGKHKNFVNYSDNIGTNRPLLGIDFGSNFDRLCTFSHSELLVSLLHDDVDNDGGTHNWGDRIQGNDAQRAGKYADDVAQQGDGCSGEDGGRHQVMVVVCN